MKPRRMRWAGHVACMGERRNSYIILVEISEGKNHLRDLGIDGRIILKWILDKKGMSVEWINVAQEREHQWRLW
jgi:hypothetical protein